MNMLALEKSEPQSNGHSPMPSKAWRKQFRFHESTQRALCRIVFVCLALIPMMLIVGYSALRITPWYQSYQKNLWEQRISDNLGVIVRFSSIEFPSPDRFRAHDLIFEHPETGREILSVAHVHASMDRSGWTVELLKPALNAQQLQSATQVIHDWFLCRPQKSASLLHLLVPELMVYDGLSETKFQQVDVGILPTEKTTTLMVKFLLDGQKFAKPAILKVERNHALEAPESTWWLVTNDVSIPCRIFTEQLPIVQYLGGQSRFQGTMVWTQKEKGWIAEIKDGNFTSVDLNSATSSIGSPVRGDANLKLNAYFNNGTIVEAAGSLDATPASNVNVDAGWLKHTLQTLPLRQTAGIFQGIANKIVDLKRLSVAFSLNEHGLLISGNSFHEVTGPEKIAMAFDNYYVGGCEGSVRTPLAAVLAWLNPTSEGNPAMASRLGKSLPWPSIQPRRIASRP